MLPIPLRLIITENLRRHPEHFQRIGVSATVLTSGTIFHSRKLSIQDYLAVIALFCNGVKGVAALRMARDMNINPKKQLRIAAQVAPSDGRGRD